jgi:hypothetical protein
LAKERCSSKIITTEQRKITDFASLQLIEVYLEEGKE